MITHILKEPLIEYHQKTYPTDTNNNSIKVIAYKLTLNEKRLLLFIPIESLEEEIKSLNKSKLAAFRNMQNMITNQ